MMLSVFVNLSFLVYITISFSYDCTDTNTLCKNTNIECSSNADCFISCGGDKSCQNSVIKCPISGNCNLECRGYKSCQNVILNATLSVKGNINILCQDATQECESLSIYGSVYDHTSNSNTNTNTQQSNDLSLKCNGDILSCHKSNIHCPANGDCLIQCQSDESCKNNTITGPNNGDLMVQCTGKSSCIQSNIIATNSDELDLTGCSQSNSCLDLTIHCPPMTNISNPNCFISGNDNLGSYSGQGINIYAINGWQDVDMTYTGSYGLRHQGSMYCGFAYDSQCSFASSEWTCADIDAYCNNVWTPDTTTPSPTDDPSAPPTAPIIDTDDDTDEYDNILYDNYTTYPPRPQIDWDSDHNTIGMLVVGGGLIALAAGCVICGAIRKQLDKAERKLSEMGFKSPFKSPYSGPRPPDFGADFGADIAGHIHHGGQHKHAHDGKKKGHGHGNKHGKHGHGKNVNMGPQRIEADSSYSHGQTHNPGYYSSHPGIHRPHTAPAHALDTYTANIHRPNSTSHNKYTINHNGTRTAEINRPHSAHNVHDNNNYNDYGQHHLAQLGVHGHAGHNNKGFKGQRQHSGHGHGHGHGHHNKRSKSHNTEMMPIR